MKIDIITLFPKMFEGPFSESIIGKAREKNLVEIDTHDLRDWGLGKYKQVDDNPFGGGAGMVLMFEPIYNCLRDLNPKSEIINSKQMQNPDSMNHKTRVIALSAKGETLKQSKSKDLSNCDHLILLCGHYEGFDQRVLDELVDEIVSIGNFVLTGGELPAMVLTDTIVRLLPGVLGNEESTISDSFYEDDKTKQYPQYTRPAEFKMDDGKVLKIPDVLLSGHHAEIDNWRKENRML